MKRPYTTICLIGYTVCLLFAGCSNNVGCTDAGYTAEKTGTTTDATTLIAEKKFADAIKVANYLIHNRTDSLAVFYYLKGRALYGINKLQPAKTCFENSIKADTADKRGYAGLGDVFETENNTDSALFCYALARQSMDKDTAFLSRLAALYVRKGDFATAMGVYKRLIVLDKANEDYWYSLACSYYNQGEMDSALATTNKASFIKMTDYRLYNLQGLIFESKGRLFEARECLQKSLHLQPLNNEAEANLKRLMQR